MANYNPSYETALAMQDATALDHDALRVTEVRDRGFVVLRIHPDTPGAVAALDALGIELPTRLQVTGHQTSRLVKWISPDEYLITLPLSDKDQFIQQAQAALADVFSAVVDNSGGYSLLRLSGDQHVEMLSKLCVYDFHHDLPVGKVVSSLLAKAPAIFYRSEQDVMMCMVRFSFANYAWQALLAASEEFVSVSA